MFLILQIQNNIIDKLLEYINNKQIKLNGVYKQSKKMFKEK